MTVNLIPTDTFKLEIDGEPIQGEFRIESEWHGMVALVSDAPVRRIIIKRPPRPSNHYDLLLKVFGGNRACEAPVALGTELVSADFKLPGAPL